MEKDSKYLGAPGSSGSQSLPLSSQDHEGYSCFGFPEGKEKTYKCVARRQQKNDPKLRNVLDEYVGRTNLRKEQESERAGLYGSLPGTVA